MKKEEKAKDDIPKLIPKALLIAKTIQGKTSMRLLHVLLDTGSTKTMINKKALPRGAVPRILQNRISLHTLVGSFESKREVFLDSVILPEFDKSKTVQGQTALVFDMPTCQYNLILGVNFGTVRK